MPGGLRDKLLTHAMIQYNGEVSNFYWDESKNETLKRDRTRGYVSFEEVVSHIRQGDLLDLVDHHNQDRYPGQRVFIVRIGDYAYRVPFEETESGILLKTAYPSRKATRDYLSQERR